MQADEYRVIYVAKFSEVVYVLQCVSEKIAGYQPAPMCGCSRSSVFQEMERVRKEK